MKITISLLFTLSLFFTANAQNTYSLSFFVVNMGIETKGTITGIQANINFDPEALAASSIVATADPNTINTDITLRDKHLKRSDYFDVAHFPVIRLESTSFKKLRKELFEGSFLLTIKGITKQLVIPIKVTNKRGGVSVLSGSFKINRLDFNLGEPSAILQNEVSITLQNNQVEAGAR